MDDTSATQFYQAGDDTPGRLDLPFLAAIDGPMRGSRFLLCDPLVTIGRKAQNKVHLPSPSVSKEHCEIRREGTRFTIKDLQSTNGVYVNGVKLEPGVGRTLCHGDSILICENLLIFNAPGGFVDHKTGIATIQLDAAAIQKEVDDVFTRFPDLKRVPKNKT
jgi:pSer/pThr/pTyr-binding forkhead associated (FHA) protein